MIELEENKKLLDNLIKEFDEIKDSMNLDKLKCNRK